MSLSEIQLHRERLLANSASLRSLLKPGQRLFAVVKGNAYGHGLSEVVSVLDPVMDGFQVDDVEELVATRRLTNKRILVLGYVAKADIAEAIRNGGELAIYDVGRLQAISEAAQDFGSSATVHLKIDALLGRQGILPVDVPRIVNAIQSTPHVRLGAVYAHFANIEDTTDLGHAYDQIEAFDHAADQVRSHLGSEVETHMSATSGLMTVEQANHFARVGLGLYGMYPSASLARRPWEIPLQPVLRWVTHLAQVKTLPARHPVGYGLTFITPREMRIGIVPQGYADGFDRGLSNSGEVIVHGVRCSVLGRIAMNMFAIDLTRVPGAQPEDEVVLLGEQESECITPEEIASRIGTINYEITTRISPLLPRRLI